MSAVDTFTRVKREQFALIDTLLNHYGYLQRGPLIDFLEVSPPTASRILAEYRDFFPHNAIYDPLKKCYVKGPDFEYRCAAPLSDD